MAAIKATNSKGLIVENCVFSGFETGIELENVEDFISKNNQFSEANHPKQMLDELALAIRESALDKSSKDRLSKDIIEHLRSRGNKGQKNELIDRLKWAGSKAVDLFVQLGAAVGAGLIIS